MIKKLLKKIIPKKIINWYHYFIVFLAAVYYRFPSKKLIVIGITGTKGKTTVAELLNYFLESYGKKTAMINSIRFKIDQETKANNLKMTMPGRFFIQKFLAESKKKKCYYVILEVTSEGIKQYRHKFIDFDMAIFTNLQPEHSEAHNGSMDKYCAAKEKLFAALNHPKKNIPIENKIGKIDCYVKKRIVINLDDDYSERFLKYFADEKYAFALKENSFQKEGAKNLTKIFKPENYSLSANGINFKLENLDFFSPLKGEFNLKDLLAAISAAYALGVSLPIIRDAAAKFNGIPGRFEEINEGQNFKVFVDFAHTPDSLMAVYKTIKNQIIANTDGQLICVLGATGGGRDKWKRPKMGEIATQYCDRIIITNEDPYDEDPKKIMLAVEEGVKNSKKRVPYEIIEDRKKAIEKALFYCGKGDCFIITGKGCEQVMAVKNGKKIPWDDRKVVREKLKQKMKAQESGSNLKFKIISHPTDIRLLIFGSSFKNIFENALLGMAEILKPKKTLNKDKQKIKIKSLDNTALLIDFLSEVLYLSNTNKAVYTKLKIKKITSFNLEGEIEGYKIESLSEDIKAVIYHESYIKQTVNNFWEALVIFYI